MESLTPKLFVNLVHCPGVPPVAWLRRTSFFASVQSLLIVLSLEIKSDKPCCTSRNSYPVAPGVLAATKPKILF